MKTGRMMEIEIEDGGGVVRRAEIDTRAPFGSVKEAVKLFGAQALAAKVYSNKLEEVQATENRHQNNISRLSSITSELEKAKQRLECAREENLMMETCLAFLKEELEKTKMELELLKDRELEKEVIHSEIEQLKFIEDMTEVKEETSQISEGTDFQIKRSVSFADPPSLTRVLKPEEQLLERQFSANNESAQMRRKKKNPFISFIGRIFSKK